MKNYKSVVFVGIVLILMLIITVGCTEEELDELVKEIGEVVSDQKDEVIENIKKDVEEKKDEVIGNIRPDSKEEKAIKWAQSQSKWKSGYCHEFVWKAYENAGIDVEDYKGDASQVYERHENFVKKGVPERGAMVLYRQDGGSNLPHTALAVDNNGNVINNNLGVVKEEHFLDFTKPNYADPPFEYLGWIDVVNK